MSQSACSWYRADKNNCHAEVFQFISYCRKQQSVMRDDWARYLDYYTRGNPTGLRTEGARYWFGREMADGTPEVSFNLCAAGVDTAFSLIGQAPSIPQYLTTDGDYKLIRQAEKASQVLQGQFNDDVKEVCKRALLDALKIGTGFVFQKFDPITGQAGVERELAFNVYVEHLDGMTMKPRVMARTRILPKQQLAAQLPKFRDEILNAPPVARDCQSDLLLAGLGAGYSYNDFVEVVEAWYLRPTAKTKGRHVLCVNGVTMLDTAYSHDDFPGQAFRFRERELGYFGSGLIETCEPHQHRIDVCIQKTARAQDLASNLIIFNPSGDGMVLPTKFTNDIGLIIPYEPGLGAPTLAKWEGTLDDLQAQVEIETQRWMMSEGLSQSQANGAGAGKGLDSGVAVRAADDVQSRRLVQYVSRYQNAMQGVARLFERMNDDMARRDPNYTVTVEGGTAERSRFLKTSNWLAIRPPKGDARLSMAAMSSLPTTPQGRFAAVQDYIKAGFCNRQYAMQLLDAPDLDAYSSQELAHLDLVRWQIEELLDGNEPIPDPRQDLDLCLDLVTKAKLKMQTMGADEDDIQRVEDFLVYAEWMLDQATAQAAPPPGAMPGMAGMPAPGPGGALPATLPTTVVAPGLGAVAA